MRFGPEEGPVVVMLLPLFEEHNRTRTFAVTMLRRLGDLGVAGVLPDVPGQGESPMPTSDTTIDAMRQAVAGLVEGIGMANRRCYGAAIRSGALLDATGDFAARWHFAPQPGASLLRELVRIKQAEIGLEKPLGDDWRHAATGLEVAGNTVSAAMLGELDTAHPCAPTEQMPVRTIRLENDLAMADLKLPGVALWRQSEPGNDEAFALALATDIANWVHACEG